MTERKNLAQLVSEAGLDINIPRDLAISGIFDSSQKVEPGGLFVATRGSKTDSHLFISDAVERGAAVLVVEDGIPEYRKAKVIRVENSREVLGKLAHAFYGNPTKEMLVMGVSGTNGKTTTTFLLESILKAADYSPGVIGTIEYRYANTKVKASNTTPGSLQLAELMHDMRADGVDAIAMEVSSHAIDQERVAGIDFDVAILTNITQDHLDYHKTMQAYSEAKKRFYFDLLLREKNGAGKMEPVAVFNIDDEYGAAFSRDFGAKQITFGLGEKAMLRGRDIQYRADGTLIKADWEGETLDIETPLLGAFNAMNVLGAVAAGLAAGISSDAVLQGVKTVAPVAGRFEQVHEGQPFHVIVDYAHTPDALERVLVNARHMTKGKIITVFGCGGDRDPGKRPIMGEVAARLSDRAIITNDNPRTEDPQRIAEMVAEGVKSVDVTPSLQLDRHVAIAEAIASAQEGDLVLIAGKGHEDYQILNTGTIHFDDREVARECLRARLSQGQRT